MDKILGIIGSPRKNGNTDILVSQVLAGAKSAGAEIEALYLGDLDIHECNGCHACWRAQVCSKKDDMNPIYQKIAESDAFVFGTPVYWYGPTALMKAFIDRLVYFNCPENRPQIAGKTAGTVIPFEEESPETAELVVKFFEKSCAYLDITLGKQIVVPGVGRKGQVREKQDVLLSAYELGRSMFAHGNGTNENH